MRDVILCVMLMFVPVVAQTPSVKNDTVAAVSEEMTFKISRDSLTLIRNRSEIEYNKAFQELNEKIDSLKAK